MITFLCAITTSTAYRKHVAINMHRIGSSRAASSSLPPHICLLVRALSSLPPRVWIVVSASSSLSPRLWLLASALPSLPSSSLPSRLYLLVSAFSSLSPHLCLLISTPRLFVSLSMPPRLCPLVSGLSSLPPHLSPLISVSSSLASRLCLLVSAFSSLRSSSLSPRLCPFTSVSSPLPPCLYLTSTSRLCPLAITRDRLFVSSSRSPRLCLVSPPFVSPLCGDCNTSGRLRLQQRLDLMGRDKPRPLVSAAACLGPWYVLVLVSPTLAGISRRGPLRALRHDMRSD